MRKTSSEIFINSEQKKIKESITNYDTIFSSFNFTYILYYAFHNHILAKRNIHGQKYEHSGI